MSHFKQNKKNKDPVIPDQCFKISYKAPKSGRLTVLSIFAKNTSEALEKAPSAIHMGTKLLYGIS